MEEQKIDEKTLKNLLKTSNNDKRKVKENFRFTLLKLLNNDDNKKNKIDNAYRNRGKWDKNSIQNIAINSLQDLFFNMVDHFSVKKPFDITQDYISVKFIESIMNSYFEDKKELENEIEELEEKLTGSGMISAREHDKEVSNFKEIIKELRDRNNKLEARASEKEEYYKIKIANADKRALEKLKFLRGTENAQPNEEPIQDIEGDDI